LCPPGDPSCSSSEHTYQLTYSNNDISSIDFAELHIASNDPADPDHIVVLSATDAPCSPPSASILVNTVNPMVGLPVLLDASLSDPGGSMIVDYQWSFAFTPNSPAPMFSSQGMVTTSFTPADPGLHIVSLVVINACGSQSATATEQVNVQ
jgi:hypothetical protein